MKIRTKLVVAFMTTALIPIAVLSYFAAIESLEQSRTQYSEHAHQNMSLLDSTIGSFSAFVARDVNYLTRFEGLRALNNDQRTYFDDSGTGKPPATPEGVHQHAVVESYFANYLIDRPYLTAVYFGTPVGGFFQYPYVPLRNYDPRKRPWYLAAVAANGAIVTIPPYPGTEDDPIISVARAVLDDDGGLIGVQSADVTLKELTLLVANMKFGASGYTIVVDSEDKVVADPSDTDNLFQPINQIEHPLYQALAAGRLDRFDVPGHVLDKIIVSHRSPQTGWRFISIIDADELYASAYGMIWSSALVGLGMIVLLSFISVILARRITAPINHVSDSLGEIVAGGADLNNTLRVRSKDEIGKLASRFNDFLAKVKEQQGQALRDQKLEAVGQLSAGIAHEINSPAQFVGDNISFLDESFRDLLSLLGRYEVLRDNMLAGSATRSQIDEIRDFEEEIDVGFIKENVVKAAEQSAEGIKRVSSIVRAMKEFANPETQEATFVDINHSIENVITVARNEWRYVSEVEFQADLNAPRIKCIVGDINQTVLNIIINAAHAIDARRTQNGDEELGKITISTSVEGEAVIICVRDDGIGIAQENLHRVFDPFFTTKDVGRGRGQGLTVAFRCIVDVHGGNIGVASEPNEGTTFTITLPINDEEIAAFDSEPDTAVALA